MHLQVRLHSTFYIYFQRLPLPPLDPLAFDGLDVKSHTAPHGNVQGSITHGIWRKTHFFYNWTFELTSSSRLEQVQAHVSTKISFGVHNQAPQWLDGSRFFNKSYKSSRLLTTLILDLTSQVYLVQNHTSIIYVSRRREI